MSRSASSTLLNVRLSISPRCSSRRSVETLFTSSTLAQLSLLRPVPWRAGTRTWVGRWRSLEVIGTTTATAPARFRRLLLMTRLQSIAERARLLFPLARVVGPGFRVLPEAFDALLALAPEDVAPVGLDRVLDYARLYVQRARRLTCRAWVTADRRPRTVDDRRIFRRPLALGRLVSTVQTGCVGRPARCQARGSAGAARPRGCSR